MAQDGKEYACNAGELSSIHGKIPWRREWLPTPVFLPGQFHGQRSLVGYSPWGHKELDTAERLTCGNLIFNLCVKLSDSFPKWLNHFTLPSGLFCFAILQEVPPGGWGSRSVTLLCLSWQGALFWAGEFPLSTDQLQSGGGDDVSNMKLSLPSLSVWFIPRLSVSLCCRGSTWAPELSRRSFCSWIAV